TTGTALAGDLGLTRAWAFDIAQRCGTGVLALKVAKDLMLADGRIRYVLIAGGYQNVDLVDYTNPRVRFLYNLGAGAGAVVVGRGVQGSRILGSGFRVDGTLSRAVLAPRGGTRQSLSDWDRPYLDVPDPEAMRERLNQESLDNFLTVVDEALAQSGRQRQDIRYLSLLHMKRSAHEAILRALNLEPQQSIYLSRYGHIGQIDQILSTELAVRQGLLQPGDLVMWVSAGIGYAWNAVALEWGVLPW
ncbi:MAG: 3-oxoacyl-ACP synthase, partial [Sulfobacillus sp.]|nr:3-oxoacyl-ACP synthase [Sulfobacillus sp.]